MKHVLALVIFAALAIADPAFAAEIIGRVVGVSDGDTLTLLTDQKVSIRIRLAEIDAPEKRQTYGSKAKTALSEICFGKTLTAHYVDTDRYGRTVVVAALTIDA